VRIERIQKNYDVEVRYVQFPLHPDTPAEGRTLEALFNCGPDEIVQKNQHMKGLMDAEGLPYGQRSHTYNSRKAQELAKWAETQVDGRTGSEVSGGKIHRALFEAYFVSGLNVADTDVLLSVCEDIGLDTTAAKAAINDASFADAVDKDWQKSRQYGVTGVPTYVVGQQGIVGAQPYEAIEQLLLAEGAQARESG